MKTRKKLVFGFFTEDMSYPASMFSRMAIGQGWNVDQAFFDYDITDNEIAERLVIQGVPNLLALTFKTFERIIAFRVARVARSLGVRTIAGGVYPTACPDDPASNSLFNSVIIGDGLGVFEDILNAVPGGIGKIIKGKPHKDHSLYARRLFSETQKEKIRNSKTLEIITAMGCPFRCYFCSSKKEVMMLPLEAVVDEIARITEELGVKRIIVCDEIFGLNLKRIRTFRELLEGRDLYFSFNLQTRANTFSDEIASEMVALGVEDLSFGIETASPKLLRFINKRIAIEDAFRSAEICKKHGLPFKINLLFGIPTQDKEDYKVTVEFVKKIKPDSIFMYYVMPFPGSPLYDYCTKEGYLNKGFFRENHHSWEQMNHAFKDWREENRILKNIDYEMAAAYMNEIREIDERWKEELIFKTALLADRSKWIVVGSLDYFYRVLQILSHRNWKNCMGYVDMANHDYRLKFFGITLPKYRWDAANMPETVIVTLHKGRFFRDTIEPLLRNEYRFKGKILSIASYGSQPSLRLSPV